MSNYKLISKIWQFAKPFRKTLLLIFLCILAIWSIEALSTIFLSSIFDIIQLHSNNINYLPQAMFFSGLAVVGVVVKILISRYQGYVEIKKLDIVVSNQLSVVILIFRMVNISTSILVLNRALLHLGLLRFKARYICLFMYFFQQLPISLPPSLCFF